jgi:hypothetical protein
LEIIIHYNLPNIETELLPTSHDIEKEYVSEVDSPNSMIYQEMENVGLYPIFNPSPGKKTLYR